MIDIEIFFGLKVKTMYIYIWRLNWRDVIKPTEGSVKFSKYKRERLSFSFLEAIAHMVYYLQALLLSSRF